MRGHACLQERRERIRKLFQKLDTDADGVIDEKELAIGLKEVLGVCLVCMGVWV